MTSPSTILPLKRLQFTSLSVGLVGALLCAVGWSLRGPTFFQSYLYGYLYWWVISMGCLGLALLYQMTGGRWGYAARPFFDSGIRTIPLLALGFIPVALGLEHIYVWMAPGYFAEMPHGQNQQIYLTEDFFLLRAAVYFLVCLILGFILTARVVTREGTMTTRLWPMVGGLGAVLLLNIVSFSAFDWSMSLEPTFFSTLYGAIFCGGAMLCGMCVVVAGVGWALHRADRVDERSLTTLHDLGKLLLAMLMVWAYLSFSQYIITYSGNLPAPAAWFVTRTNGGWQWLAILLLLFHFAVPFLLLLSRPLKRDPGKLALLALALIAIHSIEVFWIVTPAFRPGGLEIHWLDLVIPITIGALWLSEFFRQLTRRLQPIWAHWPYPDVEAPQEVSHG